MPETTSPLARDIPFDVSPSTRALLSEVLDRLAALEERDRQREEELAAIREENRALKEEVTTLKGDLRTLGVWKAPQKVDDLWEWVEDLEKATTTTTTLPTGRKTTARIEELKARLKRRRGRATFSELRKEMGLSKTQFSKLVGHLDKRIFDIQRHPSKVREKVLILRQQI